MMMMMFFFLSQCLLVLGWLAGDSWQSDLPDSFYGVNTYDPSQQQHTKRLPWGTINIVIVTDVHSWIAGNHRDDPKQWPRDDGRKGFQDADYGEILSFYQHLQQEAAVHEDSDLFFVMNGDFVDGTGLSEVPPKHLGPLLEHMPWDAINVGNHELYHDETVFYIQDHMRAWKDRYLSSNTVLTKTNEPFGLKYLFLEGKGSRLLVFGFLFDFEGNSPATKTRHVESVLEEAWFRRVLQTSQMDGILVLAHMDCLHPLVLLLKEGIQKHLLEDLPILFVTGHTHRRCHVRLDDRTESFEAGRFLDTIGFVSWNQTSWNHAFLDATKESLQSIVPYEQTPEGRALSEAIRKTQERLGLDRVLGCSDRDYGLFEDSHKLWDLYLEGVLARGFLKDQMAVFVAGTGTLRYNLFAGPITVNDVIAVCPFNNTIVELLGDDFVLEGWQVEEWLNVANQIYATKAEYGMPTFVVTPSLEAHQTYKVFATDYDSQRLLSVLTILPSKASFSQSYLAVPAIREDRSLYYLTDLWMDYVEEHLLCSPFLPTLLEVLPPRIPKDWDPTRKVGLVMAGISIAMILYLLLVVVPNRGPSQSTHFPNEGFDTQTRRILKEGSTRYGSIEEEDDNSNNNNQ